MLGSVASGSSRAAHRGERVQRRVWAGAVVVPDRRHVELRQPHRSVGRADAARRLGVLVEREQRHDRKRRDTPDGFHSGCELVEVEERLEHEEVDAAAFEDVRLLRVERPVVGSVEHLELAERADRAGDEDVAARDLRASRAIRTAAELMRSNSSSSRCVASLRRLAPNVFVSISSAPARM